MIGVDQLLPAQVIVGIRGLIHSGSMPLVSRMPVCSCLAIGWTSWWDCWGTASCYKGAVDLWICRDGLMQSLHCSSHDLGWPEEEDSHWDRVFYRSQSSEAAKRQVGTAEGSRPPAWLCAPTHLQLLVKRRRSSCNTSNCRWNRLLEPEY